MSIPGNWTFREQAPRVSIALITRDRPELLARALDSIRSNAANELPFECLVVINGDDGGRSEAVVREFAELARAIRIPEELPGGARNPAIREARGEWLLFLDDDAYLPCDWPRRLQATLGRWPQADVIGGPNLTPPAASGFQRALGKALQSRFGAYISSRRYRDSGGNGLCGDESVMLCNLLVRRSALLRTGLRFDPRLPCNEENLLVQQLIAAGSAVAHDSEFRVYHERREDWSGLARQVYKYGRGRAWNTWVRPSSVRWPHVAPAGCLLYAVALAIGWAAGALSSAGALPLLGVPAGLYLALLLLCSLRMRDSRALLIFPAIHVSYAWGFLVGWVTDEPAQRFLLRFIPLRRLWDSGRVLGPRGG